jgi:hypothetical protein
LGTTLKADGDDDSEFERLTRTGCAAFDFVELAVLSMPAEAASHSPATPLDRATIIQLADGPNA